MHRGLCIGGPIDGKWVDHYGPHYRAIISQPLPIDFLNATVPVAEDIDQHVFTYAHINVIEGSSFWYPEALKNGGMYEHTHYRDPYEFIFRRLAANYRPEGF